MPYGCVGVELNTEAVKDARKNASENGFESQSCILIDGEAEKIFKELEVNFLIFSCGKYITFLVSYASRVPIG